MRIRVAATSACRQRSRRTFLRSVVEAGGAWLLGPISLASAAEPETKANPLPVDAFIGIRPDNRATIIIPSSEMGQGVSTAFAMIVADEMDLDWALVDIEQALNGPAYVNRFDEAQSTGGSNSIMAFGDPLAVVAATAREMLVATAAARWNVLAGELTTADSKVLHRATNRTLTYGELATEAAARPAPSSPRLKTPAELRLVGRPMARLDARSKVDGTAIFGMDVRLPGMLTAALVLPPVYGAPLLEYDQAVGQSSPGVITVERFSKGVAVLARDFWSALKARDKLAATCRWGASPMADMDSGRIAQQMRAALQGDAVPHKPTGDVQSGLNAAIQRFEAVYEVPYLAHACMEPMNATAWVRADSVEIWAPTQAQTATTELAAKLTGIAADRVTVHTTQLGGGFGRRFATDFVSYAVELSRTAKAPVKVIFTREDDMRAHYYRPAHCTRLRAGLGNDGRIVVYDARTVCTSVTLAAGYPLSKDGEDGGAIEGLYENLYAIPNHRVEWVPFKDGPAVWWMRSTGHSPNVFAQESFIDELALLAKADPVEFRLRHVGGNARYRHLLERAAERSGWGRPLPAGRARGVAFHNYRGTLVATIAELSLSAGSVRVHRITTAIDAGSFVNPLGAAAMVESGVIHGLGQALLWEITLRAGQVEQGNFDSYRLPRMDEAPAIDVELITSGAERTGMGEAAVPTVAPAVANALAALTGRRQRRLPLKAAPAEAV